VSDIYYAGKALLDMKVQLRLIADIRPGLQFREAIRHAEQGELGVVQAGDIGVDGAIELDRVTRVPGIPNLPKSQTLAAGEVLLQCRGLTYRAAVVPATEIKLVASASLLILCPRPEIRPAFLAHFLNDPSTQAELRKLATGATIANLKRSALEQLETPLPTLMDQDRIIALGETLRHQLRIEARIVELRRIELRALLEKCAERNRKRANASGS
jgi:restriction endonuclease S subunit